MALSCKRYLKQEYSTHVMNDSTSDISSASPDHCRFFALSDPKEEQLMQSCLHSHLIECDRCQELRDLFLSLEEEIGKISERCPMASDDICDLRFLLDDSKDKIEQWKAHILRSVNQEEGKKEVLDKLEPTEALLVDDWAMKFLPLHFREKSAELRLRLKVKVVQAFPEACLSSGTIARSSNTMKRKRPHLQVLKTLKVMHYLSALLTGALALLILKQCSRGTWMSEITSVAYTESLSLTT